MQLDTDGSGEATLTREATPIAQDDALRPNLFIIGASKAGSSALHAYLAAHPDICMSSEKEPCFFVDHHELMAAWPIMARQPCSHDWKSYLDLWKGGENATYRGESSVYYSQTPHRTNIPSRIAATSPNARIIYTVREPVTRAIGHYWQRFKEFQEPLPLDRAIRENPIYRDTSDYALQLRAFLEYFDASQIHVVVAEELRSNRRAVLAECISWLDLPPHDYSDGEIVDKHKSPPTSRRARFPFVAAVRNSRWWANLRGKLPSSALARLRAASTVSFDKVDVNDTDAKLYLKEYFRDRTQEFEQIIGRKIDVWKR